MSDKERHKALLHKRHGWLEAPEGMWYEESENKKSYWLCGGPDTTGPGYVFPYGTRFNATSVYGVADPCSS